MPTDFVEVSLCAVAVLMYTVSPVLAANKIKELTTKSGSLVVIFDDGSATRSNMALHFKNTSIVGSWKKVGAKYCVDWTTTREHYCY